jgi:1,2-dihydroxy-3-keto-5-methylthiopentene dioxygenase
MGEQPDFRCIRFFTAENGWVGEFTGSGIAARFPSFDAFVTQHL